LASPDVLAVEEEEEGTIKKILYHNYVGARGSVVG
jgi:hypothetical protein